MISMLLTDTNVATFIAPSGGAVVDVPLLIGSIVVVPITSVAEGEEFAAYTRGVFKLPKVAATALSAGHWLKWDVSEGECVLNKTAAGDFNVGRVRKAALSADTTVEVVIDNTARRSYIAELAIADVSAVADSAIGMAPFAGRITQFSHQLSGPITVADVVVTPKIGSTALTGGAVTVAYTDSAVGDVDTSYPTAANVVAAGDLLVASSGGQSSTSAASKAFFTIEEL